MSNFREMTPQWLQNADRKNFKLFKSEHIIYNFELIVWRFRICNYFREMFKFRDFMDTLRNLAKSVFACIFSKFTYVAKQFILTESPDHVF